MNPALPESVNAGIREDSASSEVEVQALMRRLRQIEASPASSSLAWLRPVLIGGGVLVAGAAAAAVAAVAVPNLLATDAVVAELPSEPVTVALSGAAPHELTESITVTGLGELRVDRVHADGADVSVLEGVARFDVDPNGTRRSLSVVADDVGIEVFGTVFSVHRMGDDIEVQVERGEVGVRWNGESFPVMTGQSWRKGEGIVAAAAPSDVEPDAVVEAPEVAPTVAGEGLVDDDVREVQPEDPEDPPTAPSAMARPRAAEGVADDALGGAASEGQPACDVDPWGDACRKERRKNIASSPETRYKGMKDARQKAKYNADTARTLVYNANQFLDQFGDSEYADDVRAYRVEGAFYGSRASQTISFADAYLASAPKGHASLSDVEQWRRIATLRRDVIDTAQRDCAEADPHLAELIRLESGLRKDEARAHRGLCAFQLGDRDKAQDILRTIENEERLPVALKSQVRQAWQSMRAPARER